MRFFLACLILAMPVMASDWTSDDTVKEAICQGLFLIDWGQTNGIIGQPGKWENNPMLGHQPSRAQVNRYFSTVMLGHYILARNLSYEHRQYLTFFTVAAEMTAVGNNVRIGLHVRY